MDIKLQTIIDYIEANLGISLNNQVRTRDMSYARSIYYTLARRYTMEPLDNIGKLVNRDHSTVIYGLRLFDEAIKYSLPLKAVYNAFCRNIKEKTIEEELDIYDIKKLYTQNKDLKEKVFQQNLQIDILSKQKTQPKEGTERFIDLVNSVEESKINMLYTRVHAIVKMI